MTPLPDAETVVAAMKGHDPDHPYRDHPPTVTWRCPRGCAVARAWWLHGQALMLIRQPRWGARMGRYATTPAPAQDTASWWTGAEDDPQWVIVTCKHSPTGWSLGTPVVAVSRVAQAHHDGTAPQVVMLTNESHPTWGVPRDDDQP